MRKRFATVLLAVTAVLLLSGHYLTRSQKNMASQSLTLHVGESVQNVLAVNTLATFKPDQERDDTPIIWPDDDSKPSSFNMTYDDGSGSIRLPHARMVWATQYAGIVTDILVSVSQQKLNLPDLYQEFHEAAKQLQAAGWKSPVPVPTYATLESAVQGSNASGLQGGVMIFTKGTVKASLEIKGFSHQPGTALAASKDYILSLRFTDEHLNDTQETKLFNERRRVLGNADDNLTLRYWLQHP